MKFYIDDREDNERVLLLKNDPYFNNIKVTRLDVGDILIQAKDKEDIIVEVKTFQDWSQSVFNNRLRKEVNSMKEYPIRAVVVYDDGKFNSKYNKLPAVGHHYSITAELMYRWHIPVFFCEDFLDFKSCIKAIIKQVHQEYKPLPFPIVKQSNKDEARGVLSGIPGVGEKTLDLLLDNFDTPGAVFKASDEKLDSIGLREPAKSTIKRMR